VLAVKGADEAARDPGASFMSVITSMLLDGMDEAFDKKSWHGPNLRGAIRGVTAVQAAWRPAGDRHNIWELTLHAAYWKYVVRRKILREKRGSFVLTGSNFFERPDGGLAATEAALTEAAWKHDIAILESEHRKLRDTVAQLPARALTPAMRHLIRGVAAHDLYHAGQIRLLRRMCS
jgi:DinB superfamily